MTNRNKGVMTNRNKGIMLAMLILVSSLALMTIILMEIDWPDICVTGEDHGSGDKFTACLVD